MASSPLALGNAKNQAYVAGNNAFTVDLTSIRRAAIRVTVAVSAAAIVYVRYDSQNLALNANSALVADSLYTFVFGMDKDETFNFRFSANVTIRKLQVEEVDQGVI